MNIINLLKKISSGKNLTFEEAAFCMNQIMSGKMLPSQFGALMVALANKGESAQEIAGMASEMRAFSLKIKPKENAIDVCGTGGSGLKWFNISTASSILLASLGIPIAKHGNRAMSGNSGSADVLEELGVNITLDLEKVEDCLNEINISFIFAQSFHPAMKYAAPLRKEIGIRTIFNFLGPLTNPASVKKQIIGTPNKAFAKKIAEAAKILKSERIITLSGASGADEIEIDNKTIFYDSKNNFIEENIDFERKKYDSKFLIVESPKDSAKKILDAFESTNQSKEIEKKSIEHSILMNASIALYLCDFSTNFLECYDIAKENIYNGKALKKLNQLIEFTNRI
jgi:anthranilate phosphoribosyltransferase